MPLHRFAFRAMAAVNEVQVHAADRASAAAMAARAITEVRRIEEKFSRYREASVVSRINAQAGGAPVAVDEETARLLDFADACWRQSGGLFDATSGVLRRAWRFEPGEPLPSRAALDALLPLIGWDRVERTSEGVRLPVRGMELDFGGFGKEYAADRAAFELREAGAGSALVNLAGDIAVIGSPDQRGSPGRQPEPWRVGVQHPRMENVAIAMLPVMSGALATSGDYERYVEIDGVRHCHVLDPRTGRSARGFRSVTVHGESCIVAGSASTIAMLKGREAGLEWLDGLGLAHFCVLDDGAIVDRFPAAAS